MKKSKKPKTSEREDGVDRISELPDPIIQLILSRIPTTEEVIRTRILSTRWKHLWTSIPTIDIHEFRRPKAQKFNRNKFKEFVEWVLANKSLDLEIFRLCCTNKYNMSTLGRWIQMAVTKNVKGLDLTFCPRKKFEVVELPNCMVTCSSLLVLRLFLLGHRLSLPNYIGFPQLRILELKTVKLSYDDLVEKFFKSCPLLEELSLIDCFIWELHVLCISCPNLKKFTLTYQERVGMEEFYKYKGMCATLHISCPKLVYFKLTGEVATVIDFKSMYSLEKVVIHPEELSEYEVNPLVGGFAGISHVKFLSISLYCVAMCYNPVEDVPVSLPNLMLLEISMGAFAMDILIPFLKCFPDLKSLLLIITQVTSLEDWKLDDDETMRILSRHLKSVEFLGFDGDERKLVVARSLLEHGKALVQMDFYWSKEAEYHEKSLEAMKEVSNFYKASPTVKLKSVIEPTHM